MDSKGVTMSEDSQYQKVTFWLGVVTCNCSPSYLGKTGIFMIQDQPKKKKDPHLNQ
jgi:hypothetical protein